MPDVDHLHPLRPELRPNPTREAPMMLPRNPLCNAALFALVACSGAGSPGSRDSRVPPGERHRRRHGRRRRQ